MTVWDLMVDAFEVKVVALGILPLVLSRREFRSTRFRAGAQAGLCLAAAALTALELVLALFLWGLSGQEHSFGIDTGPRPPDLQAEFDRAHLVWGVRLLLAGTATVALVVRAGLLVRVRKAQQVRQQA